MRITCPNCGAQYEVDDALIPESGRDVQCSSCGKGWFQSRHETAAGPAAAVAAQDMPPEPAAEWAQEADGADLPRDETDEVEATAEDADTDRFEPEPERSPDGETETEAEDAPEPRHETEDAAPADDAPETRWDEDPERSDAPEDRTEDEADRASDDAPGMVGALPPRKTDESILAFLREEAEREIAQRRQEAATLESQPDLGLPESSGRAAAQRPVDAAAVGGTRQREILPDIDAINSSLRSDQDRRDALDDETLVEEQRRGFRMGFGIMLGIAAALIALYVGAGWLAETVPALAPALAAYLELANGLRTWIDGLLAAGVDGLSALLPPPEDA